MKTYSHPNYEGLHIVDNCPVITHDHTGLGYKVHTLSQLMYLRHIRAFESQDSIFRDQVDYGSTTHSGPPRKLTKQDSQCIIGARLIPGNQHISSQYTYKSIPNTNCYNYEASLLPRGYYGPAVNPNLHTYAYNDMLSVVYLTKCDGLINHDVYFRWCKETSLPFPEDLVHTPSNQDKALSSIKDIAQCSKNSYHELGIIDSIRKKRTFLWAVPFIKDRIKNIDKQDIKVFNRIPKSSYQRPWTISTYTKLAERRERRARNKHKQVRNV